MSTYVEGLSDIYAITAKIQELQQSAGTLSTSSSQTVDIESTLLQMQKSFSSMLNNLMFSSNDDDDDDYSSSDPFAFLTNSSKQIQELTLNKLNTDATEATT